MDLSLPCLGAEHPRVFQQFPANVLRVYQQIRGTSD